MFINRGGLVWGMAKVKTGDRLARKVKTRKKARYFFGFLSMGFILSVVVLFIKNKFKGRLHQRVNPPPLRLFYLLLNLFATKRVRHKFSQLFMLDENIGICLNKTEANKRAAATAWCVESPRGECRELFTDRLQT
jgi:hypothetical protein